MVKIELTRCHTSMLIMMLLDAIEELEQTGLGSDNLLEELTDIKNIIFDAMDEESIEEENNEDTEIW